MQENTRGTPDQKIASKAKDWRAKDKKAIAAGATSEDKRGEYRARRELREVIDNAREH